MIPPLRFVVPALAGLFFALCPSLSAQPAEGTETVLKGKNTNTLTESIVIPTGKTITINSGGSIINNGTATGFAGAWADITGKPTTLAGYGITDAITAAAAALAYHPLTATSSGGNGAADSGKIVVYDASGQLFVTSTILVKHVLTAGLYSHLDPDGLSFNQANGFDGVLAPAALTANRAWTLPDKTGTVAMTSDITGVNSGTNTGDQTITLTGDVTGSGTGSFAATLANTAVTAGSYTSANITVDAKGRITAAASGSSGLTIGTTTTSGASSGDILTSDGTNLQKLTPGTGVSAWLAAPTLANLNAAVSDADLAQLAANIFTGVQTLAAGTVSAPSLTLGDSTTGIYRSAANEIAIAISGVQAMKLSASGKFAFNYTSADAVLGTLSSIYGTISIRSDGLSSFLVDRNLGALNGGDVLIFSDSGKLKLGLSNDVVVARDAAGVWAQRNGTAAQVFRLANTYASSTSNEYFVIDWQTTPNTARIGTVKGSGGGTAREWILQYDATEKARINSSGVTIGSSGTAIASIKRASATLVAGTATVSDTATTANTVVLMSVITPGGTVGTLDYDVSAGSSYTINSSSATDTSVVNITVIHFP